MMIQDKHNFKITADYFPQQLIKEFITQSQALCDVTLVSDDSVQVTFPAHRAVLSSCSETFKSLLLENSDPSPVIHLQGCSEKDLKILIDFMYMGVVKPFTFDRILELSEFLKFKQEILESLRGTLKKQPKTHISTETNHGYSKDDLKAIKRSIKNKFSKGDDFSTCPSCGLFLSNKLALRYHIEANHYKLYRDLYILGKDGSIAQKGESSPSNRNEQLSKETRSLQKVFLSRKEESLLSREEEMKEQFGSIENELIEMQTTEHNFVTNDNDIDDKNSGAFPDQDSMDSCGLILPSTTNTNIVQPSDIYAEFLSELPTEEIRPAQSMTIVPITEDKQSGGPRIFPKPTLLLEYDSQGRAVNIKKVDDSVQIPNDPRQTSFLSVSLTDIDLSNLESMKSGNLKSQYGSNPVNLQENILEDQIITSYRNNETKSADTSPKQILDRGHTTLKLKTKTIETELSESEAEFNSCPPSMTINQTLYEVGQCKSGKRKPLINRKQKDFYADKTSHDSNKKDVAMEKPHKQKLLKQTTKRVVDPKVTPKVINSNEKKKEKKNEVPHSQNVKVNTITVGPGLKNSLNRFKDPYLKSNNKSRPWSQLEPVSNLKDTSVMCSECEMKVSHAIMLKAHIESRHYKLYREIYVLREINFDDWLKKKNK